MDHIGQKIKELRKKADMTQDRLAEMLGVTAQAVSKWEVGSASPDLSLIAPLCKVFGVTADELLGIAEEKENTEKQLLAAHRHCMNNRAELGASDLCGCFFCRQLYRPQTITKWADRDGNTALCPFCGIDSVIGSASGYPMTAEFLSAMYDRWFKPKTVPGAEESGMTPGEFRDYLGRGLGRAILLLEKEKDKQVFVAVWQRMLLFPENESPDGAETASYFARPHDVYDRDLIERFDPSGRLGEEIARKILDTRPPRLDAMKLVSLLGHEEEAEDILRADYERTMARLRRNLRGEGGGDFGELADEWVKSAFRIQECVPPRKDVIRAQLYDLADLFRLAPPDRARDRMDLFYKFAHDIYKYTWESDYVNRDVWDVLLEENPLSFALDVKEAAYSPLPQSELTVERFLAADPDSAEDALLSVSFKNASDDVFFAVLDAAIDEKDPGKQGRLRSLFLLNMVRSASRDTDELLKRARRLIDDVKQSGDKVKRVFLLTIVHILAFVRDPRVRALGMEIIRWDDPILRHDGYRLAYEANFMPEDADLMEEWLKESPDPGFSPAYGVMAALKAGAEGVRESWLRTIYEDENHRFMLVKTLIDLDRLPDDMRKESLWDENPYIRGLARGEASENRLRRNINITWHYRNANEGSP